MELRAAGAAAIRRAYPRLLHGDDAAPIAAALDVNHDLRGDVLARLRMPEAQDDDVRRSR